MPSRALRLRAFRVLLALALFCAQQAGIVHALGHASEHADEDAPTHVAAAHECCLAFHATDDAPLATDVVVDTTGLTAHAPAGAVATSAPPGRTPSYLPRAPPVPA